MEKNKTGRYFITEGGTVYYELEGGGCYVYTYVYTNDSIGRFLDAWVWWGRPKIRNSQQETINRFYGETGK